MYLLQATQQPVKALLQSQGGGFRLLVIPKMLLPDILEWSDEVKQHNMDALVAGLEEQKRLQVLAFYPPVDPGIDQLRGLAGTLPGMMRIMQCTLPNALVFPANAKGERTGEQLAPLGEEEVTHLVNVHGFGLRTLARELLDGEDTSYRPPEEEGSQNPTKTGVSSGLPNTPSTGSNNSPSSAPPIPASTPSPVRLQSLAGTSALPTASTRRSTDTTGTPTPTKQP